MNEDVSCNSDINIYGDTVLILCDGCTLDCRGDFVVIGTLTIYGQTAGSGILKIHDGMYGLRVKGDLSVYGGELQSYDGYYTEMFVEGNSMFLGGKINVKNERNDGLSAEGYNGAVICGDLTLGYRNVTDSILLDVPVTVGGTIQIAEGQRMLGQKDNSETIEFESGMGD